MSDAYRPDNDATAGDPWDTAFLSDRDVSGQVPINYVPHPGVYLTPSCFGSGTYEDAAFEECFSNLLASEFRRFVVDLYWDTSARVYRLCPVEIPPQTVNGTAEAQLTAQSLNLRQISSANATTSASTTMGNFTSPTSASSSPLSVPTSAAPSGATLYEIGPYKCTNSIDIDTVMAVLSGYIAKTSNTIQARLQYLILNMHAASTPEAPTSPRANLTQAQLPASIELVNNYLGPLGATVYTPFLLGNERENLNTSWFGRQVVANFPLLKYFTTITLANGDLLTPDGWPCENYVQIQQGWRLLISYGSVDSGMSGYNFDGDNSTIFVPGSLTSHRAVQFSDSGSLNSGCFYSSTDDHVNQINSSWATFALSNIDASILSYAADNLTTCGISPILNYTLNGQSAGNDYTPYQSFGNQALFSWAAGEPQNATVAGEASDDVQWACALMVSNDDYKGHWRVYNCRDKYRVACREGNQPYIWSLSEDEVAYADGADACTGNSSFGVPRTGLENLYLYQHIQSIATSQNDPSLLDGVWVNFNSIAVDSCWVTTGLNGTCPYNQDDDAIRQRTILVPTIGAFITLCITALTILVKCNTNRRKSKVRKRGEGGWDYEGVPS